MKPEIKKEIEIEIEVPEYVEEVYLVKYPVAGTYLQEKHPKGLNAWKLFIIKSNTKEAYIECIKGKEVTIKLRHKLKTSPARYSDSEVTPPESEFENRNYCNPSSFKGFEK